MPEEKKDKNFKILKENLDAVKLFLSVQTQFKTGFGGVSGLDYAAVLSVANMYSYDLPSVFEDLQVMEMKALELINMENK